MASVQLELLAPPDAALARWIGDRLTEHALPAVGVPGFHPIAVVAHDDVGERLGAAYGLVNWSWLHLQLLWVAEELRGTGLGGRLLGAIEEAGAARGCEHVHLDTFSFQARPFYERHGYTVFGTLEDYPKGHARHFMRKPLGG